MLCCYISDNVLISGRRGHRGGVVFDDGGGDGEQPRISGRTAAATELITYDRGMELFIEYTQLMRHSITLH